MPSFGTSARPGVPEAGPAGDLCGCEKRELVGNFKNPGQEWRPKGSPLPVRMYDFRDRDLGIAIPYGVYDLMRAMKAGKRGPRPRHGPVCSGDDRMLVEKNEAAACTTGATRLLITADGGGSNYSAATAFGNWACSTWLTRWAWRSRSASFLPGRANGTRSSTGGSATLRRTGRGCRR